MRISVERLRIGLLVGAGLLVVAIAAFLGYARWRVKREIANLPGRLGATITRESNGYTYSQSDGKNTVFTIHAAKAVEHTDGRYTLHDVQMVLYGHKGDRADRISGSEFEYDTKEQVIRAVGLVHIDLAAPVAEGTRTSEAAKHLNAAGSLGEAGEEAGAGSRVVHVTTRGLVYVRKLATAATDQQIEFAFGGFTGHAVGAEYNSDNGHLALRSAVTVSGIDRGKPIALAASHGELDRTSNQADFNQARYSSAGEVVQAEMAHLHLRTDGTLERIEGVGRVVLEGAGQGSATSDRAEVLLDAANKPRTGVLAGNVKFNDDEAFRQARGGSQTAELRFDEHGRIDHAVLRGAVHTSERVKASEDEKAPWSERTLTAETVELTLATEDSAGKAKLRDVKAAGLARLSSVSTTLAGTGGKKAGTTTDNLAADELQAHFIVVRGAAELSTVHGSGHTVLGQIAPGDVKQTSSSDTLDAMFREAGGGTGAVELAQALQQGGVVIDRSAPAKRLAMGVGPGVVMETQHAVASRGSYDADTDKVTLSDGVQMTDATSAISAGRVVIDRDTGDATAEGAVKVTYLQDGSAEPVHVLAARAELERDAGRAVFYGRGGRETGGSAARMWQAGAAGQGGSQLEAPVLVFEQEQSRLTARAEKGGAPGSVHAVLASAKVPVGGETRAAGGMGGKSKRSERPGPQMPVRITSSELVYSDAQKEAMFSGGVRVVDADGEMRADAATVFMVSTQGTEGKAAGTAKVNASGMMGGQVERIVAVKHVQLTQPGRLATGDRLVYTASDQMFVLTGTAADPPKVVDAAQGSTTGSMLRFHSGDDSVSVLGSDGVAQARKVHTETYIPAHTGAGAKPE